MSFAGEPGLSLARMDSMNLYSLAMSHSLRMPDMFGLNMSYSVGRSNSRFDLNRQATNMSQMSVGGFKMQKDVAINQNGEVIVSALFETNHLNGNNPLQNQVNQSADFGRDLDDIMFDKSINYSKAIDMPSEHDKHDPLNDLISLPCQMTNSQEMDPQLKLVFKSLLDKSHLQEDSNGNIITNSGLNHNNNHQLGLGESLSVNSRQTRISVNLTQLQNESILKYGRGGAHAHGNHNNSNNNNSIDAQMNHSLLPSNSMNISQMYNNRQNHQSLFSVSLMDRKIGTNSEPDYDIIHMREFMDEGPPMHMQNNHNNGNNSNTQHQPHHYQNNQQQNNNQMHESSGNFGMTIEPFEYNADSKDTQSSQQQNHQQQHQQQQRSSQQQQQQHSQYHMNDYNQYPHSDDEATIGSKLPIKKKSNRFAASPTLRPEPNSGSNALSTKQQKGSQYRQSRHKNVFKNFGGTLVRFIVYNQYFQDRVIEEMDKDATKQKGFHDWLQNNVKLERKKDFQVAWTTFKTDSETIRQYKALLRELSKDFFENFSFIYLINSKKISDMEIHLRSIHTYLAAINQPDSLERFKPV